MQGGGRELSGIIQDGDPGAFTTFFSRDTRHLGAVLRAGGRNSPTL